MIELRDIVQTYRGPSGPVEALRGVDLQVKAGEVSGIIGRSGGRRRAAGGPARHRHRLPALQPAVLAHRADKDKPWVAKLVKACHSDEVRRFIQTEFRGAVIAGF